MNFRKIFNLDKSQPEPAQYQIPEGFQLVEDKYDFNPDDFKPDMLGQSVGRLSCPQPTTYNVYNEEYETALGIVQEFKTIHDYKEQLAYWDAHPKVFGYACIIVFDTYQKEYWPYYSRPQDALPTDLGSEEGRYESVSIFPDLGEFWLFIEWCAKKQLWYHEDSPAAEKDSFIMNVLRAGHTNGQHSIPDIDSYWGTIKTKLFHKEYLTNLLAEAKNKRDSIDNLPSNWGGGPCLDEMAKKYFFFLGSQDAENGQGLSAMSNLVLISVIRDVLTCPLSTYGEIVSHYFYGYHTTLMVAFFQSQKERMDRGENIKIPAVNQAKEVPDRQPFVVTPANTLVRLFNTRTRYEVLWQLGRLAEQPILIYAPDYKLAQHLYDKRFPGDVARPPHEKIWISYADAYSDFEEEFNYRIDTLIQDKEGRMAYIERMFAQLHELPAHSESLDKLVDNLLSEVCRPVINSLDVDLRIEIMDIAEAASARNSYVKCVSLLLERQREIEGISTPRGWLEMERGTANFSEQMQSDLQSVQGSDKKTVANETTKAEPCPSETNPRLFIPNQMQTRLFKTLSDGTPADQHEALSALLENGSSENRIWVKWLAGSIAYVFKQAREATSNPILANQEETADWVAFYFRCGRKSPREFQSISARNIIRDNGDLTSTNKIRLKQ